MANVTNTVTPKVDTRVKPIYSVSLSEETYGDHVPVTLQGGLRSNIAKAAMMGFGGVEIHTHTPQRFDWDEIQGITAKHGMVVTALGTGLEYAVNGLSFTSEDDSVRKRTRQRFFEFISAAARMNAVVFLGLCRGKAPRYSDRERFIERLSRELSPLADMADRLDVTLALEPIVFYLTNILNNTAETIEFLESRKLSSIGLLLDTHHMFIEDRNYIQSFRDACDRIVYIHVSDSSRRHVGSGNVDFTAVGDVLKEIDYDHPISAETLPVPSGEESARTTLAWMKSVWG